MVFVTRDHVLNDLFMVFTDRKCLIRIDSCSGTDPDCRNLVDDHDSFTVAQAVHFFRIWIMAGTERICMQPVNQIDIFNIQTDIHTPSMKCRILMFSKPFEVKWFSIDQKRSPLHAHRTHAKRLLIIIITERDCCRIQIRCSRIWLPQFCIRYHDLTGSAFCLCHFISIGI